MSSNPLKVYRIPAGTVCRRYYAIQAEWQTFVTTKEVRYMNTDISDYQLDLQTYWFRLPASAYPYTTIAVRESDIRVMVPIGPL